MPTEYLWVEKFRPNTLDNFVGNEQMKAKIAKFIATGDVPHLLFSGQAGTGKTTLAKILIKNIPCDSMYINASDENNVDTMRNKIKGFASTAGFNPLKIVVLDEADFLTQNSQAALRNILETFSKNTRFILTCNYVERIIDPILSRTQQYHVVPPSKKEVAMHVWSILQSENVEASLDDYKLLVDAHYPDIRKIINECQLATIDNKLVIDRQEVIGRDYKLKIVEELKAGTDARKKFQNIRQIVADAKLSDYSDLYKLLYDNVAEYSPGNISGAILAIAEGQYRDGQVPDKEINAMAMLIQLLQTIK